MQRRVTTEKALQRKYPEPVVLVLTQDPRGRTNLMPVSWVMMASSDPWMFALGIDDGSHTYHLIRKTREFVVALPSETMAPAVLYAGTRHGWEVDKLAATSLRTHSAEEISVPLLADAVANFECRLVKIVCPGDCPIVFGAVVAAHENTNPRAKRLYNWSRKYDLRGVRKP